LDLARGDPARLERHDAPLAERDGVATGRDAPGLALEGLAELDPLRCQHWSSAPRAVGAARHVVDDLTTEDPDLDPDRSVRCLGSAGGVVDVGAQRVQRHPTLAIALGPCDLGATQATRCAHPDSLGAHPHRALHRALHRAAERDPLHQLSRDVVGDQLGRKLRPLDLLDIHRHLARGAAVALEHLRQLLAQLVDLGALLADHHSGTAGVDRDRDLAGLALDVHLGDRGVAETLLDVVTDQAILAQQRRHLAAGVPARDRLPGHPELEPDRMGLLSHYFAPFFLAGLSPTAILTWLVRLRIGVARPCAAAVNRLSGVPISTCASTTTSWSTSNASFSFSAACSALATADLSVLAICIAASFLLNWRIAYASLPFLPRIRSITRRILRGD